MSHAFSDNEGRKWQVVVNIGSVRRVKNVLSVDLYKLLDEGMKGLAGLVGDLVSLAEVVYWLCKEEADSKGITDENFYRSMSGDCLTKARDAFLEAYTDFFPDPKVRSAIRKVTEAGRELESRLVNQMEKRMGEIDIGKESEILMKSLMSLPESPALSPTH